MELHQSPPYLRYMKLLKWQVFPVDSIHIFMKKFPLVGSMMKIQRAHPLPSIHHLLPVLKEYSVKRAVIEASEYEKEAVFRTWVETLKKHVTIISSPYLPSKTLRIDLTHSEDHIFDAFTEAKRRAVRRALKNHLTVREESSIRPLIEIKNKSAGFLGFITTHGLKELWEAFGKEHATTVLSYTERGKLVGGVLLLFWDDVAYYWIAGATGEGKKLFAPTLLAWEAIKIAKHRGVSWFDWVGVWDERFPKENKEWKGFTKFKEGFGGEVLYYPTHR